MGSSDVTHNSKTEPTKKEDPKERSKKEFQTIKKAAGGKHDLEKLKHLVESEGWTAQELSQPHADGKSPLHHAAWTGSLEKLQYLLDFGCDVNVIATGQYTYGKTPIFFAATKCRNDAVKLLLEYGANPCIVNNKGQSVRSIASSHLLPESIQAIENAEKWHGNKWVNYRATHSDGLIYGDQEPRFFERTITADDNVTELAINPTTAQIRRGNFARNNPTKAQNKQEKQKRRQEKNRPPEPTEEEWQNYEQIWTKLRQAIDLCWRQKKDAYSSMETPRNNERSINMTTIDKEEQEIGQLLLRILKFWERQRRAWLPETSKRLQNVLKDLEVPLDDDRLVVMFHRALDILKKKDVSNNSKTFARDCVLLEKLVMQALEMADSSHGYPEKQSKKSNGYAIDQHTWSLNWQQAWKAVHFRFPNPKASFQNPDRHPLQLSLPRPPRWIDSLDDILHLHQQLEHHLQQSKMIDGEQRDDHSVATCAVMALDTEWCDVASDKNGIQMATLQISWLSGESDQEDDSPTRTCVVDLNPDRANSSDVQQMNARREAVARLIHGLFEQKSLYLLWFAMGHDIPKLSSFVKKNSAADTDLSTERCLDLQFLLAEHMKFCADNGDSGQYKPSNLPGLKACSEFYFAAPASTGSLSGRNDNSWVLSKSEQCSDWAQRPLTASQLEYAGLDAAILLGLLAQVEQIRPSVVLIS